MQLLIRLLGLDRNDAGGVLWLLWKGFLIGIFLATFEVAASTFFLANFNEKIDLPFAFMASGALGLVTTWLFSAFHQRVSFAGSALVVFGLVTLAAAGLWLGYQWQPDNRWLAFFAFICVAPFNTVILLIFWGIIGRMFNLQQERRILGSVDNGMVLASVIAFFSLPLLLQYLKDPTSLLLIGALFMAAAQGVLVLMVVQYGHRMGQEDEGEALVSFPYRDLLRNRYTFMMALFVIVSMVGTFFVDYSFLQITAQKYPNAIELGSFISRFSGVTVVFSFLAQTIASERFINTYGLRVGLLVNPGLLALFTLLAVLVGTPSSYLPNSEAFIFFFLAISLSKMMAASLREAFDDPIFKLFFFPLDSSIRMDVRAKLDGVVRMLAA